uniref:Uncharacterized protein n=1 Tax=Spermophilus dauricus TaxID=99837 RepID=A0A8C9PYL5_SPEDA
MSRPAATALNWKKCRFDLPRRAALQACKRIPGKFTSSHMVFAFVSWWRKHFTFKKFVVQF